MYACRSGRRTAHVAVALAGLLGTLDAMAAERWFPVRTHNPFLQIFGLPEFAGADVLADGRAAWHVNLDIANHADASATDAESITLDGESYYLTASYRRAVRPWLELGIDVPLVAHGEGYLDPLIEGWHDLFGMTNSKRQGPSNELDFRYERDGQAPFEITDGSAGLGDIRLKAAVPLRVGALADDSALSLRGGIKLPTGDARDLHGSGGTDAWLALHYSDHSAFGLEPLAISAHAGVLLAGDSDYFSAIQESTVPFGGFSADWHFSPRLRAMAAVYAQGKIIDSDLDELGSSIQLIVGGDYRFTGNDMSLSIGIVEELFSDATVDFAIQVSLHSGFGDGV